MITVKRWQQQRYERREPAVVYRNASNLQTYRILKSTPQNNKGNLRSGEEQCSDLTKKKKKDKSKKY